MSSVKYVGLEIGESDYQADGQPEARDDTAPPPLATYERKLECPRYSLPKRSAVLMKLLSRELSQISFVKVSNAVNKEQFQLLK